MPGAATYTEKSTVLVNFEDTTTVSLISSYPERTFTTWVFEDYPPHLGVPNSSRPPVRICFKRTGRNILWSPICPGY